MAETSSVLVIGAGVAGMSCARALQDAGTEVTLVDKARRPGGRVSTRRSGGGSWDHGAQYFTVRDPRFERVVDRWRNDGVVGGWTGTIGVLRHGLIEGTDNYTERYVGIPKMSAIAARLAEGLGIHTETRVVALERRDGSWNAGTTDNRLLTAGRVVVALPAPLAVPLLPAGSAIRDAVGAVEMTPCFATMVDFETAFDLPLAGAFVEGSTITWAARDSSKPGRDEGERWVLHAARGWSRNRIDEDREETARLMLEEFAEATRMSLPEVRSAEAHLWRYSGTAEPLGRPCLWDGDLGLGVCGDWCPGGRVEGAWTSGKALADEMKA